MKGVVNRLQAAVCFRELSQDQPNDPHERSAAIDTARPQRPLPASDPCACLRAVHLHHARCGMAWGTMVVTMEASSAS